MRDKTNISHHIYTQWIVQTFLVHLKKKRKFFYAPEILVDPFYTFKVSSLLLDP